MDIGPDKVRIRLADRGNSITLVLLKQNGEWYIEFE